MGTLAACSLISLMPSASASELPAVTLSSVGALDVGTSAFDITWTAEADNLLTEFRDNVVEMDPSQTELAAMSANDMRNKFLVLRVKPDVIMANMGLTGRCKFKDDVVVASRDVAGMKYRLVNAPEHGMDYTDPAYSGSILLPQDPETPCSMTLDFSDADASEGIVDNPEEDPAANGGATLLEAPYISHYDDVYLGRKYMNDSWNQTVVNKYVEKYDGNSSWNYYGVRMLSTCEATGWTSFLNECGAGQRRESGSTLHWTDWSPNNDSEAGGCRTIDVGVDISGAVVGGGIGYSYQHCETYNVNLYSEAGKLSAYWEDWPGTQGTRGVVHQIGVKVCQTCARPNWTYWVYSTD
ncbi:hypothetical protein [Streptomyces sp. NPDC005125]